MRSTSFTNFIHLGLNQGVNVGVALLITPLLYQRLGAEYYGMVFFSLTVVTLLGIVVRYGFHLNGPKRIALLVNNNEENSILISEILITRFLLSAILVLITLVAINLLNLFAGYAVLLSFSLIILFGDALMPLFILQGLDRLSLLSKANAVSKLAYLILVYFIVQGIDDARWVNFFFGLTMVIVNFLLLVYIYRQWHLKLIWNGISALSFRLKDNFTFFVSTVGGHISVHGGLLILKNAVSDEVLGQYSLAQRVAFLLRMVPVFLTQSILQNASRLYTDDRARFSAYLKKAHILGLIITFGIGVTVMISSPWVILIVGGEKVVYSTEILRILCFIPFLGMLNVSNMIKILVAEYKEILSKATWFTAGIMLVLGYIGSKYYGGHGLAVALLVSEVLSFAIHYFMLKRHERNTLGN